MAIDTFENQLSALNFGSDHNVVLPVPPVSPTLEEGDFSTLLGLYREIELESIDRYTDKPTLTCLFGAKNIDIWGDLDGSKNATRIRERIIEMMLKADEFINNQLRDGPYLIPFVPPYPKTINNLSARLTGMFLYESRGLTDSPDLKHELHWHQEYVVQVLKWILNRKWRLDYSLSTVRTHVPSANGITPLTGGTLDENIQPSPYSTRAKVESIYGLSNVIKWADLDGDRNAATIEDRINKIIGFADNEINCRLRAGPYKIPFDVLPYDGMVVDLSARLTGVLLYEARGSTPVSIITRTGRKRGTTLISDSNSLIWNREQIDRMLNGIMSRRFRFDRSKVTQRKTTPIVV